MADATPDDANGQASGGGKSNGPTGNPVGPVGDKSSPNGKDKLGPADPLWNPRTGRSPFDGEYFPPFNSPRIDPAAGNFPVPGAFAGFSKPAAPPGSADSRQPCVDAALALSKYGNAESC